MDIIWQAELWQATLLFIVIIIVALIVSISMWKVLPQANFASYEGKQWKLGGAFAAFIAVSGVGVYMIEYIIDNLLKNEIVERDDKIKDLNKLINKYENDKNERENIDVINPSENITEYRRLFANLDNNSEFYGYNAPFALEKTKRSGLDKETVITHVKRYTKGIKSNYLFFREDGYERAIKFFEKVKKQGKSDKEFEYNVKIQTMFDTESEIKPCHAFFLAKQNGKHIIIYYPDPYSEGNNGVPDFVIKITGSESIYKEFLDIFDKNWRYAESGQEKKEAALRGKEREEEIREKQLKGY